MPKTLCAMAFIVLTLTSCAPPSGSGPAQDDYVSLPPTDRCQHVLTVRQTSCRVTRIFDCGVPGQATYDRYEDGIEYSRFIMRHGWIDERGDFFTGGSIGYLWKPESGADVSAAAPTRTGAAERLLGTVVFYGARGGRSAFRTDGTYTGKGPGPRISGRDTVTYDLNLRLEQTEGRGRRTIVIKGPSALDAETGLLLGDDHVNEITRNGETSTEPRADWPVEILTPGQPGFDSVTPTTPCAE